MKTNRQKYEYLLDKKYKEMDVIRKKYDKKLLKLQKLAIDECKHEECSEFKWHRGYGEMVSAHQCKFCYKKDYWKDGKFTENEIYRGPSWDG